MRILVTGGAGFIGSHLCRKLLAQKEHYVICLDNLYTGNMDNIKELMGHQRFGFIKADIAEDDIPIQVDRIFNLACPASPKHYQKDAIYTMKTNIIGSMRMLELARRNSARILQASTSEVYGNPLEHPQKEDYWGNVNCTGVRSCYDEGKRGAETLFMDYHRKYGVDVRIVRIFNTYGPHMHIEDGRVVSSFIVKALQGEPIEIYGDGTQTRSFCYIDDLVSGIIKMMEQEMSIGPVNLGSDEEYTVQTLAEKVISLTGSSVGMVYKPLPEDDPVRRRPCISKAKELLGWNPKITLEEGLLKTIEYFRKQLENVV